MTCWVSLVSVALHCDSLGSLQDFLHSDLRSVDRVFFLKSYLGLRFVFTCEGSFVGLAGILLKALDLKEAVHSSFMQLNEICCGSRGCEKSDPWSWLARRTATDPMVPVTAPPFNIPDVISEADSKVIQVLIRKAS